MRNLMKILLPITVILLVQCASSQHNEMSIQEDQDEHKQETKGNTFNRSVEIWFRADKWEFNRFRSKKYSVILYPEYLYEEMKQSNPEKAEKMKVNSLVSRSLASHIEEVLKQRSFRILSTEEILTNTQFYNTFFLIDTTAMEPDIPGKIDLYIHVYSCRYTTEGGFNYSLGGGWWGRFTMDNEFYQSESPKIANKIVDYILIENKNQIEEW